MPTTRTAGLRRLQARIQHIGRRDRRRRHRVESAGRRDELIQVHLVRLREVIAVEVGPAVGRRPGGRTRVARADLCRSRAVRPYRLKLARATVLRESSSAQVSPARGDTFFHVNGVS